MHATALPDNPSIIKISYCVSKAFLVSNEETSHGVNSFKLTWTIWTLLSQLCFLIMICIDAILLILNNVSVACVKMDSICFFIFKNYSDARYKLMDRLLNWSDLVIIDTHLLLWGNNALPTVLNNSVLSYVQTCIHETRRLN